VPPEAAKPKPELTPERWHKIKDLLATVIQLPAKDRPAYLDKTCAGDAGLRAELESLIAAHEIAQEGHFERPLSTSFGNHPDADPGQSSKFVGKDFGAYRMDAEIGRGGMGKVYRAQRADDRFSKKVAIKLLDGTALSQRSLRLFRHEREILANLEHPNIARLLDAGENEGGVPYFVMEYVDGQPIDVYCDMHRLTVEQRLLLFLKVCSAVHYAHQNLVIHRDIKPANILVTESGEPKLLDFGIAKIDDANANTRTLTAWGMLTPAYASPEQLLGRPLNIATDVYSLGLVLYELLTGRYAYGERQSAVELQRAILEEDPQRPSAVVFRRATETDEGATAERISGARQLTPQKLHSALLGDLESIVLKAVRKEPTERYVSVERFMEDIESYLHGLPVRARQGTMTYRFRKFVLRNRTVVIAGGVIGVLIVAGIVLIWREARIARLQQARAERRFNDVRKLANSLLFELDDTIQDLPGSTPARKLIVERSLQYLDSLSSESGNDPGLLRELATAYERVGELQGQPLANNLGETTNSLASYQKALSLRRQLGERPNAEWRDRLSLAGSYRRMAEDFKAVANKQEALADLQNAVTITESMAKANQNDLNVLYELGSDYEALSGIGDGDFTQKALATQERILSIDPKNLSAQRARANDIFHIGNGHMDAGRTTEALASFHQALQAFLMLPAPRDRRRAAAVYNAMGQLYERTGDHKLSLQSHRQALDIYKTLVSEDPKNVLFRQGLAISYVNIGDQESKYGRMADGLTDINNGLIIMKAIVGADPTLDQRDILAQVHKELGDVFAHFRRFSEAIREYQIAIQILETVDPRGSSAETRSGIAEYKVRIADSERLAGNLRAARADFQEALTLSVPQLGSQDEGPRRFAAKAYAGLADIEVAEASGLPDRPKRRHWEQAGQLYRRSLDAGKQVRFLGSDDLGNFDAAGVARRLRAIESDLRKMAAVPKNTQAGK
jgi:non-specific serine/threonine protein kinase/serine/threonine-protein kinase